MKKFKTRKIKMSLIITILSSVILTIGNVSCDNNATKPEPPIPTATVIINISTSDSGSVEGATVILRDFAGETYLETATSSTVILNNIQYGSYLTIIRHTNYREYYSVPVSVQNHTIIQDAHLIDIKPQIGEIISFGQYTWIVLDRQDEQALIVSESVIERRWYHFEHVRNITWAECSLREYLNNEFSTSNAFSDDDRSRIIQVTNINEDNQWFGKNGGENTLDYIFLLSIAEVVKYFGDSGQLENRPHGAWEIDDQYNTNRIPKDSYFDWWWLRSPGYYENFASIVHESGSIYISGRNLASNRGIRPAMWIKL